MSQFQSLQEEVVHAYSARSIGASGLFIPDTYGVNRHEPADLAWVAGRCVILMNMTNSRKALSKKTDHNLSQMRRWLGKWRAGARLTGRSTTTEFDLGFGDIDHILLLSIVDGQGAGCLYHHQAASLWKDFKVSGCATITDRIMRDLAWSGGCARDLVSWVRELQKDKRDVFPERELAKAIRDRCITSMIWAATRAKTNLPPATTEYHAKAVQQTVGLFSAVHAQAPDYIWDICADMNLADIHWFAFQYSQLEGMIAKPGKFGTTVVVARRKSGPYNHEIHVFANSALAAQLTSSLINVKPGIILVSLLDFTAAAPIFMYVAGRWNGTSRLSEDLTSLRDVDASL